MVDSSQKDVNDYSQKSKKKIQSSIPTLSVGDERKCFNQIRKASLYITQDSLLWNGMPAGKFALDYVIGHHMKRKKKAEEKQDRMPEEFRRKRRTRSRVFDELGLDNDVTMSLDSPTIAKSLFDPKVARCEENVQESIEKCAETP